jgi:hypothetical protein
LKKGSDFLDTLLNSLPKHKGSQFLTVYSNSLEPPSEQFDIYEAPLHLGLERIKN